MEVNLMEREEERKRPEMASRASESTKGKMTVAEAGRRGGRRTAETHGEEFYSAIGRKGGSVGGPKVRKLIQEGKEREKQ
jgi:general stress protein YciG